MLNVSLSLSVCAEGLDRRAFFFQVAHVWCLASVPRFRVNAVRFKLFVIIEFYFDLTFDPTRLIQKK